MIASGTNSKYMKTKAISKSGIIKKILIGQILINTI